MKARGKCEAKRSTSPLDRFNLHALSPEKGGIRRVYFGPSGLGAFLGVRNQGRRASRLPLAIIFRAFGAICPGCYCAPLADVNRGLRALAMAQTAGALISWIREKRVSMSTGLGTRAR